MFFKRLLVAAIVLGILAFIFGDYILWFQANTLNRWQYYMQAHNSCEKLVHYYPNSVYRDKAKKLMVQIREHNIGYLHNFMDKKDEELRKQQKELEKKASFR